MGESESVDYINKPPLAKYKEYMQGIIKIRNEVLMSIAAEASSRQHDYKLRNQTGLTVKEGDVVLWEHGNNQRTLATVIGIYPKPSNTVKIRFSATQEPKDVRIRSLKVLVPSDAVENECLGSNKVDDMTEEISRAVESAEKKVV